MSKQLQFKEEARAALLRGVNVIAHAVKVTLAQIHAHGKTLY